METVNDALLTAPGMAEILRRAERDGTGPEQAVAVILAERERSITRARSDPFRYGYEPDIWLVARALLGLKGLPEVVRLRLAARTGHDEATVWRWWTDELCSRLEMARHVRELMWNGANRSAKTDGAAKLCMEVGQEKRQRIMIGSQMLDASIEVQQKRMWRYLPEESRRDCRTGGEYIKYTEKNGFTGNSFINKQLSMFKFVFYSQEQNSVFEGKESNMNWMDEEVPLTWIQAIRYRIASVMGRLIVTFTPVSGYTDAVADYQDGMRVLRSCQGYMLPRDGEEAAPWAALGLGREELETLRRETADDKGGRPQTVPSSRPEDCVRWVTEPWRDIDANVLPGRVWERVPRLALCRDPQRAVIWSHGRDNPYGNPLEVIGKALGNASARDEIKTRCYGIAIKKVGKRFKRFDRSVHVVSGAAEARLDGVLCYREWPGGYDIPGVGVPDPWAKPSGRNKGANDGDADAGQTKFGFSLLRYKFEFARLEGWNDYEEWKKSGRGIRMDGGWMYPDEEELELWHEANGSRERVAARFVDGRAAQGSKIGLKEDKTLLDLLNELGMAWMPASGKDIVSGEERITSALEWSRDENGVLSKVPMLHYSEACANHIFAMEKYTGADKQSGACKEPVDTQRYLYQSGCVSLAPGETMTVCVLDPAPERNWFVAWYRICGDGGSERSSKVREFESSKVGEMGEGGEAGTGVKGDRVRRGGEEEEGTPCAGGGSVRWSVGR